MTRTVLFKGGFRSFDVQMRELHHWQGKNPPLGTTDGSIISNIPSNILVLHNPSKTRLGRLYARLSCPSYEF